MTPFFECRRAGLELRLDQRAEMRVGAAASASAAGRTSFSEMKLTSITTMSGRSGTIVAVEVADIGAFQSDQPGIVGAGSACNWSWPTSTA